MHFYCFLVLKDVKNELRKFETILKLRIHCSEFEQAEVRSDFDAKEEKKSEFDINRWEIIALIVLSATFFISTIALASALFCKEKNHSNDLEMADFPNGPNPSENDWDSVQPEQEQAQNEQEQAQW